MGQEEVWTCAVGGNWSLGSNWLDGTAPGAAGSPSLALRFATTGGTSTVSTHDLNNGFLVNRLTFSQASGSVLTLASSGGRNIVLTGAGTQISQENAGAASITAPLLLNPTDNVVTVTASSAAGTLSLDAAISGASALSVGSGGLGTVRLNAANSHSGPTMLTSGTLEFANDAAFGSGDVWIGAATLRLLGPWTTSRGIQVSGSAGNPNNIDLSRKVDTNGFDATWNGTLTGVAALTKSGEGTLALTTAAPFSGNLTVNGGTMLLRGGAAIQSDRVSVTSGAELRLDQTGSTVQRLKSGLALTLSGGGLRVIGDSTTATSVNIGSLTVRSGGLGSNIRLVTQETGSVTLQAGTFTRQTAEMLVRADALGGASGTTFSRLRFGTIPSAVAGIIPGVYAGPTLGGGESFTAYNASSDAAGVIGLQSLAPAYSPTTVLQNPATPSTAHALIQPGATTIGSSNTIRSLTFESGGTLSQAASQTLAVTSGQVLVRSGAGPATLSGGTLAFGAQSGTVALFGDLVLTAAVTGSAGWTKLGPGVLTLGTQPTGAAAVTIGTGPVRAFSPTALAGQMIAFAGTDAVFDLAGSDATVGGFTGTGSVNLGGGTLTLGTTGEFFNFSGTFVSLGQVRIEDGGEQNQLRILNLRSTPASATVTLVSGRFEYRDANTTNPTPLTLAGGSLEISNGTNFRVPLILAGDARIRGGSYFMIDSPATITGPGALRIDDTTELSLRIAANHTGETIISGYGSSTRLRLEGTNGSLTAPSAVRIHSGELYVNYGTSTAGRLNDSAPIYIRGGQLSATGPTDLSVIEQTGALRAGPRSVLSLSPQFSFTTSSVLDFRPAEIIREDGAALKISADYLGNVTAAQRIEIHPATAPAMIGGGAASGTSRSIIPWIVASPSISGLSATFTTHDPVKGLQPLNPSTEFAQSLAAVNSATDNLRLSGTETLAAPLTVNSLLLSDHDSFATLNGTVPLTITSGAVLTDSIIATINAPLNFGSQEAIFHAGDGYITVNGQITGSGGLTKVGSNGIALSGTNVLGGTIRILEGYVDYSKIEALGADTVPVHLDGGSLNYTGSPAAVLAHPISLGLDGGLIRTTSGTGTLSITGKISGSGSVTFAGSGGEIVLSGTNDHTGDTIVGGATLKFTSDAALGEGAVRFTAGELQPTFAWTTNRTIYPSGNATVSIGNFDVNWNGPVLGGGGLMKYGAGVLTIRDADEYSGGVLAQQGLVVIEGSFAGGASTNAPGTVVGNGTWDGDIYSYGTVAPGLGIATLTARNVTLRSSTVGTEEATLALEILSPTEFDRLVVRGTFEIVSTADLQLTLGYDPIDDLDSFLVVDNDGTDLIIGAPHHFLFQGNELEEGERFVVGSQGMRISYIGGDGNDVVLYAVPEPTTLSLLLAGIPWLFRLRRKG